MNPAPRILARLSLVLVSFVLLIPVRAEGPIPGVEVSASRPALPILVRNERGPLVRVVVTLEKFKDQLWARNDVRLTSMTFSLAGTDDVGDLQSLALLSSDDDDEFRQRNWPNAPSAHRGGHRGTVTTMVGEAAAPAAQVTIQTDRPLVAGKNVFWLSGRLKISANLNHRLVATCTAVGTSAGSIVPHDESPGVRQRIGVALRKPGDDGVDTYAIPALATTAKGTLLCVYDMRWNAPGHDLQDHITTGLSRSTDGGQTWEPMRNIMDMGEYGGLPRAQNGCSDPGLVVDQKTGEIFCFAIWMNGKPGHHQWVKDGSEVGFEIGKSAQFLMIRSRDDGVTWSKPENLTRKLKDANWVLLAPSPSQGIQLADGTLVMPVEGRYKDEEYFSTIITSRDHGATWTRAAPMPSEGANECQAVELGDGSIMLNARVETKGDHFRSVYVTHDLGQTWQAHGTDLNRLIEPSGGCNGSIMRMDYSSPAGPKHILVFFNPRSGLRRVDQTLQVSFDDGKTWPRDHYLLVDEGRGWAYPCFSRIDAQHVGLAYAGSQADVVFQVFSLAELLGKAGGE